MKQKDTKMSRDKLLALLASDEEVKEAIKKIASYQQADKDSKDECKEEIEVLQKLVDKWKNCFSKEEQKSKTLEQNLDDEKIHAQELKANIQASSFALENEKTKLLELSKSKKILQENIESYKEKFDEELSIYAIYESLTDDTKSSLKGIFKNDSFAGFMACGVQDKNIHSLWDYTQNEVIENRNEDIEKLVKIFVFFSF